MIYAIVPQLSIVLALVAIIVILGRKLPRAANLKVEMVAIEHPGNREYRKNLALFLKKAGRFSFVAAKKLGHAAKILLIKIIILSKGVKNKIAQRRAIKRKEKLAASAAQGEVASAFEPVSRVEIKFPVRNFKKREVPLLAVKPQKAVALLPVKEKAAKETEQAIADSRGADIGDLLTQAERLVRIQQFRRAEEICLAAVCKDPKNAPVYKILGNLYLAQHNTQDAANSFKEALRRGFSGAEVYKKLGLLYTEQGKWKEATKIYQRALKNKLAKEYFYLELGKLYRQRGESNKARDIYANLVREYPGNYKYIELLEKQRKMETRE